MTDLTPTLETDSDGTRRWYAAGELHRVEGPAIEWANGNKAWYLNGGLHRIDGPAIELAEGYTAWFFNGERHRTDGPAIEQADVYKAWYLNGGLHRTDGPAIERADGGKEWYLNGGRITPRCSHVLTAAFARSLPIPEEALADALKAMAQAPGPQIDQLKNLLHKYWPMHVKNILVTLLSNPDPVTKHMAFSLLGREGMPEGTPISVHL